MLGLDSPVYPVPWREAKVVAFLEDLAGPGKVSAFPQNQALNALSFLYALVLEQKLGSFWGSSCARGGKPDARWRQGKALQSLGDSRAGGIYGRFGVDEKGEG